MPDKLLRTRSVLTDSSPVSGACQEASLRSVRYSANHFPLSAETIECWRPIGFCDLRDTLSRPWPVSVKCHRMSWKILHTSYNNVLGRYGGSCLQAQHLESWGRGLPWVLGQSSLKSEVLSQNSTAPLALFQHKILVGDFLQHEL